MNFKQHLINNIDTIFKSFEIVDKKDPNYFDYTIISKKIIDLNTISIIMTTCNRSKQTLFTIETISKSEFKNIQIIIVDDSTSDPINPKDLEQFNIHIELLQIKNKFWLNPCINYNLGFNFIKGNKVIIQNAEVCHIGDVITYINENLNNDNEYFVFDVGALSNLNNNENLYKIKDMVFNNKELILKLVSVWYQHHIINNRKLHFLTSMTKKTFDQIKGFDFDYCVGTCYDDDDFLFKIMSSDIKINCISLNEKIFGIHQWHESTPVSSIKNYKNNSQLLLIKKQYYNNNKKHLILTNNDKETAINFIKTLF